MKGRPQSDEAAEYYHKYIDLVRSDDVVSVLGTQLQETLRLLRSVSEEKSLHRYAPGKWSLRQVLNHVTDTERVFLFRALWFARGFDTPLASFDQNVAVQAADADAFSWESHIADFQAARGASITFFANLPEDAWSRKGIASDNPVTTRALAYIVAGHLAHHVGVMKRSYL
jgi:uncharacterized damage-inducible protein DinB